ncbi:hypothetical protein RIB2604_00804150 [Aspergillus luchuensis]|uniref:Uncharacterized protein n=1 Tax=Aspergillus kawachii TaxID=1069201 RepID=A0A146F3R4_ASPKA|nr:hypothetical protein RIB2604_00804150 [Aspergillus luchuensis]
MVGTNNGLVALRYRMSAKIRHAKRSGEISRGVRPGALYQDTAGLGKPVRGLSGAWASQLVTLANAYATPVENRQHARCLTK